MPDTYIVTGGSGFVGQRLVEVLVERGAKKVFSFDIAPAPKDALQTPRIVYVQGDISDAAVVSRMFDEARPQCVFHLAAAVGPYHPTPLYTRVNVEGTRNILSACRQSGCKKMIYSSSPSTRLTGADVDGLNEDQLPDIPMREYLQEYARTKALGELLIREETARLNSGDKDAVLCCAVAPHQVYGPRDNLFLPNILEAAGTGRMRIFGNGLNRICFTHVDNYSHGLILGACALYPGSPALGKFYIVTDGDTHTNPRGYSLFYESLDEAIVGMGFTSIYSKFRIPYWLIMFLAILCAFIERLLRIRLKLNPFTVKMLTMHRWFGIENSIRDLHYQPILSFKEEWPKTIQWFREHWLPVFLQSHQGLTGLYGNTQRKIDIAASTLTRH
ncbi:MAG: NAD-dependent epimerase/dehydratase family protein [archaeon]|nr:NAD-dependent epimerase/dehydratase family protein [archaeon]